MQKIQEALRALELEIDIETEDEAASEWLLHLCAEIRRVLKEGRSSR